METKIRSWVKSITYRVIAIVVLGAVSYLVTGNWKEVTAITILFNCIQVIIYYVHERIWRRIPWGGVD